MNAKRTALIVGAGSGLSASVARLLARRSYAVSLAARSPGKLETLATGIGASVHCCDASDPGQVTALFESVCTETGVPDVVVYNASGRLRGPIATLDPGAVRDAIAVSAYGGFLVGQRAAQLMLPRGSGTILFTGASASVKGYAQSAPFAMGKFALRGLAQSMARELAPRGIHVAHVVIDGAIRSAGRPDPQDAPDSTLDPDAIAETYCHLIEQKRSAWAWEVELRPWVERF